MTDPVTSAIATAVAGSAAQTLTAQATQILAQITSRIRHRLRGGSGELAVLDAPDTDAGSHERTTALAALLHSEFREDPAFASELTALWRDYLDATASPVVNTFHGSADKVVQLRDVHGNLTIS